MSFISEKYQGIPIGFRKILYFHWPIALLLAAVSCIGFLMLFSVSGGNFNKWAEPQIIRFCIGFIAMIIISFTPISFWRNMSIPAYLISLILLFYVEYFGITGKGAQRWIDLGFIRLQPSEFMKISLVMIIALYYDWLSVDKVSKLRWLLPPILLTALPMILVLNQPDLGTAILLASGAAVVMLLAGVSLWYFMAGISSIFGLIYAVILSRGTDFQILKNYQYQRIETFLDPSSDPLGTGYHITQSKIALGSGGYSGRGFMQGTQSLNFLPEKHTDFIFTTFAEEFGFLGGIILLLLYLLIIFFCYLTAMQNHNRFSALLTLGIAATFFFYFSVNMLMVMGLAPVVGVPLPLVSYGGSAMLVLLGAFGLVQSAHIHRAR